LIVGRSFGISASEEIITRDLVSFREASNPCRLPALQDSFSAASIYICDLRCAASNAVISGKRRTEAAGLVTRFFEPFKYLRCGDRPFRQMRIDRARGDV